MQYYKPDGEFFVGDCMPFFHDGVFHLYYLLDENHHQSLGGLGGHQWAHATSRDLVHWEHHPLAIAIDQEWEGSICTGSVLYHEGTYYAFYATRRPNRVQHLSLATSSDGIHFSKQSPNPFAEAQPGYNPLHYRDPKVFRDEQTGLFHMLVTAEQEDPPIAGHGGCLAHLTSTDLWHWELHEPWANAGYTKPPECPDYFYWRGWYYLIFSHHWSACYRMSRQPFGPWLRPAVDSFDCPQAVVLKTAPFVGDRRIGVAFICSGTEGEALGTVGAYGGNALFRELVQHEDGSLGTCFPAEMIPATGEPLSLTLTSLSGAVSGDDRNLRIRSAEGLAMAALESVHSDVRITLRVNPTPGAAAFGLILRGAGNYQAGHELRIEPHRQKVGWRHPDNRSWEERERAAIYGVTGLDQPFTLDIVTKGDILDVCIDGRRTLVNRVASLEGDRLFFFSQNGAVGFEDVRVRPLQ